MDEFKVIILMLLASLVFGVIGATLLQYHQLIMGAVCFLISGFILGVIAGIIYASFDDEEEEIK